MEIKQNLIEIIALVIIGIALVVVLALPSCTKAQEPLDASDALYQDLLDGKGCKPTALTCRENTLMICNADHEYMELVDCGNYQPPRQCCELNNEAGCYLPGNCRE